jgi:hypothetical protein
MDAIDFIHRADTLTEAGTPASHATSVSAHQPDGANISGDRAAPVALFKHLPYTFRDQSF